MSGFARAAAFVVFLAVFCGHTRVDARPNTSRAAVGAYQLGRTAHQLAAGKNETRSGHAPASSRADTYRRSLVISPASFAAQVVVTQASEISTKWVELQGRILADQATLAGCRSGQGPCPAAAQRFLSLVELGRRREGRARIGHINRAVNLSIRPISDLVQYGVDDFWAAPLTTMRTGAGDCEDYAIVKYLALREVGIAPENIRLLIVRDVRRQTNHAVVAVRHDHEWLILDNRTMVMIRATDAQYWPLFFLDDRGVAMLATAALSD